MISISTPEYVLTVLFAGVGIFAIFRKSWQLFFSWLEKVAERRQKRKLRSDWYEAQIQSLWEVTNSHVEELKMVRKELRQHAESIKALSLTRNIGRS